MLSSIDTATARADSESAERYLSLDNEFEVPFLLLNGGVNLADQSAIEIDGFHLGVASLWSLLPLVKTPFLRAETLLGLDFLAGSWNDGYVIALGTDLGVGLRVGYHDVGLFTMGTWMPTLLVNSPVKTHTQTTLLGYRLLLGMSWHRNNFGLAWRSIGRKHGYAYRAVELFLGVGF